MMKQGCETLDRLRDDLHLESYLLGERLEFRTTWGLFSPRDIDEGSRLLLEYLQCGVGERVLDLGCGYGPLGLAIGRQDRTREVHLVDRDYLAVEYCNRNAQLNRLPHCRAYLSNGFSEVESSLRFDTVVSNLPAKVGRELLTILLCDAHAHLHSGGQIVVVTINGLREFIKRNFKAVFGNYQKLKQGRSYCVARAVKE